MDRRRSLTAVLVGTLGILVAALMLFLPYLRSPREVVESTPSVGPLALGGLVPIALGRGDDLCLPDIPLTPASDVVRFWVSAPDGSPPALAVRLKTGKFGSTSRVEAGWRDGPLEVPVRPPEASVRGSMCIETAGDGR